MSCKNINQKMASALIEWVSNNLLLKLNKKKLGKPLKKKINKNNKNKILDQHDTGCRQH